MLPTIWVPSQPCRFRVCRSLLLVATFIASILVAPSAHAATIEVTTTVDELNTDGDCSLREAIIAANEDRVVDACAAGNGRDTITLVPGRYELSIYEWSEDSGLRGGDIDITTDLDITTSGAGTTTINGMLNNRVFDIHASATVSITNLTIQGGSLSGLASDADAVSGAGIRNRGVLTIKNSTVANNTAGGPACKCGGYEGRGGGIYSSGTLLLVNTTISNNTALGVGFTPDKGGRGGGIANDGTLTISSSTISHNEAGRTAGGVDNGGTLRTWNTLIGQNHLDDCRGTLNSLGYNLIEAWS